MVAERRRRPAGQPRLDRRCDIASLLLRRRRDAGDRLAVPGRRSSTVSPMAKISGWPGTERSGATSSAAGAVGRRAQPFGRGRSAHAGGPDDGAGRRACCRHRPRRRREHSVTGSPSTTSTPMLFERGLRIGREIVGKAREHARAGLDQHHACLAGVDVAEVAAAACACASSAMVPASSTPVGPAPMMTKVSSAARRCRIALALGALEGDQDAPPQRGGVLQRLQARRERLPFVMAEIGVARAGGEHQRVVGQRVSPSSSSTRFAAASTPVTVANSVVTSGGRAADSGSARRSRRSPARRSRPDRAAAGTDDDCAGRSA